MTKATLSWIIPGKTFPVAYVDGEAFGLTVHSDDLTVIDIPTTTVDKLDKASLVKLTKELTRFLEMEVHD